MLLLLLVLLILPVPLLRKKIFRKNLVPLTIVGRSTIEPMPLKFVISEGDPFGGGFCGAGCDGGGGGGTNCAGEDTTGLVIVPFSVRIFVSSRNTVG